MDFLEGKGLYDCYLLLNNGSISCVELTKYYFKKAQKNLNNAFLNLNENALELASVVDQEIANNGITSFVQGLPYNIKDLFLVEGMETTANSKILENYFPSTSAFIYQELERRGALLIGKTSCDEFGMGSTNEYVINEPVTNPNSKDYVSGGSSGGVAASVMEGSSAFGIGSDTGGSARIPASFCGAVGFKPSYGLLSRSGLIAHASSLDTPAPIARNPLDIACILESISNTDPQDSTQTGVNHWQLVQKILATTPTFMESKRIGYCPTHIESCEPPVRKKLQETIELLRKMKVNLVELTADIGDESLSVYHIISSSEASSNLSRFTGVFQTQDGRDLSIFRSENFGEEVKRRIIAGTFCLSTKNKDDYFIKASKVRRLIVNQYARFFEKVDFLFLPTVAHLTPKIGELKDSSMDVYSIDRFTVDANLTGYPAISIPCLQSDNELPVGFQLMAAYREDEKLLQAAHAFDLYSLMQRSQGE